MTPKRHRYGLTAKSVVYAVIVHAVVALFVFVSFKWNNDPQTLAVAPASTVEPVKATVVPEQELQRELAQLKAEDERKQQQEKDRELKLAELERAAKELEQKRSQEEQRLAAVEQQRKEEEQKSAEVERKRKAEELKLAEARKREEEKKKAEAAAEKKRLAKLEQEKEAKRQAERKRKEEQQRLAEQKRKQQEEQARVAQQQLERQAVSAFAQYRAAIRQKVSRNWIKPAASATGLSADVLVRVSPNGDVIDARVVRSSGDQVFDRSVVNAVLKASPLPIPPQRQYYDFIREFKFEFEPGASAFS